MSEWKSIDSAPDNKVVWTKISDMNGDRNIQKLKRSEKLWFIPDGSIYVYYIPAHWKKN